MSSYSSRAKEINIGITSILFAEEWALRFGLYEAVKVGIQHLHIEGDGKIIIEAIQGNILSPRHLDLSLIHI